ncbi:MAG: hypothetical protein JO264_19185 [Acidisphaera sp.]|nr:hypothetical protein [Acidisphaera sp.]
MSRPVLVGSGDCVMDAILQGIRSLPAAEDLVEIHFAHVDATGPARPSPEILRRCTVLIEEAWPWNGNSTLRETDRVWLPTDCTTVLVPALHFNTLWPLVANDPRNTPDAGSPAGLIPYAVGDRLALQVIKDVADPKERLAAYLERSPLDLIDVDRFHQLTMHEFFRRERGCDVRVAAHVLENFRHRRLFFTHTNPTPELLRLILVQIYGHPAVEDLFETSCVEAAELFDRWAAGTDVFAGAEAPIHPDIARHFGLEWYDPAARYAWNGRLYSFEEWVAFYLSYAPDQHAPVAA